MAEVLGQARCFSCGKVRDIRRKNQKRTQLYWSCPESSGGCGAGVNGKIDEGDPKGLPGYSGAHPLADKPVDEPVIEPVEKPKVSAPVEKPKGEGAGLGFGWL